MNFCKSLFFISLTLSIGACALFKPNLIKPKVDVQQVQIKDADHQGATLLFFVEIDNPNKTNIVVDTLRYKVVLNQKKVSEGVVGEKITARALEKTVVQIPLRVLHYEVFESMLAYLRDRKIRYELNVEAELGYFTIPFRKDGEIK